MFDYLTLYKELKHSRLSAFTAYFAYFTLYKGLILVPALEGPGTTINYLTLYKESVQSKKTGHRLPGGQS